MLHRCWLLDAPVKVKEADIGAGIMVPAYAAGPTSHGWWAMVITLVVAGMVWALLTFSYVFLWSRAASPWAPPWPRVGAALVCGLSAVALAAGARRC